MQAYDDAYLKIIANHRFIPAIYFHSFHILRQAQLLPWLINKEK